MRRLLENICLFVLAVVVGLRPMVEETYNTAVDALTASLETITSPSPLVSLGFDLIIIGCALLWLVIRAAFEPRCYRRAGLEWGLVLLLIAGAVSCSFAGNQRIAINATIDWLCYPLMAIVLVQVTPLAWQRRVLLCVILASACVQSYRCFEQVIMGKEFQQDYEQRKADGFWERQGVPLDSPQVILYERRLYANEAAGYLAHSNVAGAYLVMCGLAAAGVAVGRWRSSEPQLESCAAAPRRLKPAARRCLAVLAFAVAAAILAAAALTRSKGAAAAFGVGAVVWALAAIASRLIDKHRRLFLVLGWSAVVGAGAAVIGYGWVHGSLPGASLDFRWRYWTTSSHLVDDHWWTGVGRENFGRHYLQYKTIDSPEEIASPHNLLVQTAAEWGVVGLAGVVLMLVGASVVMSKRPVEDSPADTDKLTETARSGSSVVWCLGLGAAIFLARVPLLGSDDVDYIYWETAIPVLVWVAAFGVLAVSFERVGRLASAITPGALLAVNVALFAFMAQETINFGLFVPGSATSVFALAAVAISSRSARASPRRQVKPWGRWLVFVGALGGGVCVVAAFVLPVIRGQEHLYLARYHAREKPTDAALTEQPAYRNYAVAAEADPLDPTPFAERSGWLAAVAAGVEPFRMQAYQASVDSIRRAIERDPDNVSHYRQLASILISQATHTGRGSPYYDAVEATGRVVELYPNDPSGWRLHGACALKAGKATQSRKLMRSAVKSYRRALELDDARPDWEQIRRFTARQREEIQHAMKEARDLLDQRAHRGQ